MTYNPRGYRQPSTTYEVGDIKYHSALPTGWYLECTTPGISGSGDLTISSPTIGGTVTDGTATWTVRKMESTEYRSRVIVDSAAAHNAIYRGKDLTAYFNSGEMSAAIADGSFRNIYPGDYVMKSISVDGTTYDVRWEVADLDYFLYTGDGSGTNAHHIVFFPSATIQTNVSMNNTSTTEGGYIATKMWTEVMPKYAAAIKAAFGTDHVLTHRELLSSAVDATAPSMAGANWLGSATGWSWKDVDVNIPSEPMIYGGSVFGSAHDVGTKFKQLSIFRYKGFSVGRKWFWLQAVASSSKFAIAYGTGYAAYLEASYFNADGGVRPYFLYH